MTQQITSRPATSHTRPARLQVIITTRARAPSTALQGLEMKLRHPVIIWVVVVVLLTIAATLITAVLAVGFTLLTLLGTLAVTMGAVATIVTRLMRRRSWRSRSG